VAVVVVRGILGSILLFTGLGKLLDVPGFVGVLETYRSLPAWSEYPVAVVLVLLELKLAECLLLEACPRRAALVAFALHVVFLFWVTYHVMVGAEVPNCGCFGVFLARPLGWGTVVEDALMCCLCGWLFHALNADRGI